MRIDKSLFKDQSGLKGFLTEGREFAFDDALCSILKELKFNYETEGFYSSKVLVCRIEDNIEMIKSHLSDENDAELYFYMCFPAIAFATRLIEIPEWFRDKYKIEPWIESLIRQTYFNINININGKDWSYTDSECEIYLGDKRPYGNSYVLGDISTEYFRYNSDKKVTIEGQTFKWSDEEVDIIAGRDIDDLKCDWIDENSDFFWNIMHRSNDTIRKMLKEIDYSNYMLVKNNNRNRAFNHYTESWEINETIKKRNDKIINLIEDE